MEKELAHNSQPRHSISPQSLQLMSCCVGAAGHAAGPGVAGEGAGGAAAAPGALAHSYHVPTLSQFLLCRRCRARCRNWKCRKGAGGGTGPCCNSGQYHHIMESMQSVAQALPDTLQDLETREKELAEQLAPLAQRKERIDRAAHRWACPHICTVACSCVHLPHTCQRPAEALRLAACEHGQMRDEFPSLAPILLAPLKPGAEPCATMWCLKCSKLLLAHLAAAHRSAVMHRLPRRRSKAVMWLGFSLLVVQWSIFYWLTWCAALWLLCTLVRADAVAADADMHSLTGHGLQGHHTACTHLRQPRCHSIPCCCWNSVQSLLQCGPQCASVDIAGMSSAGTSWNRCVFCCCSLSSQPPARLLCCQ